MQELVTYLTVAAAGVIAGAIQWQVYIRNPFEKMPFLVHLNELRRQLFVALALSAASEVIVLC